MASSPIALGHRPPAFAETASRYVYVAGADVWCDLHAGVRLSRTSFDGLLAHRFEGSPSRQLLKWHRTSKVERLRYAPGVADLIFKQRGEWCLNHWKPSTLCPKAGDWPHIALLIEGLFPNDEQRAHLLDALAYTVQVPTGKLKHALVLTGVPGCGKTTLADIVGQLVGVANYSQADGHLLTGRWLNPFVDCQVLAIEEVMHGERFEVSDKLKTLVTATELKVEAKNIDFYMGHTPNLIILLSNDRRPLALTKGARREWMPDFVEHRPDDAFFQALHSNLETELPHFLEALLRRDIACFNADAPPPMTAAKAEAIEDSRSSLEVRLEAMLAEAAKPFDRDVVLLADVALELRCSGAPATEGQIRRTLRNLGCRSCSNQAAPHPRWSGSSPRVWCVRNRSQWFTATKAELRDELLRSDRSAQLTGAAQQPVQLVR